jgi:hypothetical protein
LIAWELIGVRLDSKLFPSANVELLTPEAAPYVLIVMVLYLGYRTTIEWFQCDERRRALWVSKIDIGVAHTIGATSLVLYITQRALEVQLASEPYLSVSALGWFLAGFAATASVIWVWQFLTLMRAKRPNRAKRLELIKRAETRLAAIMALLAIGTALGWSLWAGWPVALAATLLGVSYASSAFAVFRVFRRRRRNLLMRGTHVEVVDSRPSR